LVCQGNGSTLQSRLLVSAKAADACHHHVVHSRHVKLLLLLKFCSTLCSVQVITKHD
jgi:hypothetical protein